MIQLFTKPGCPPCMGTKRALDNEGIEYEQFDVTTNVEARARVEALGYSQMPVVFVDANLHWSGLRMTEIEKLAKLSD